MQASLVGNSSLQYVQEEDGQEYQNQEEVFSPIPAQNKMPSGVSPFSQGRPDTHLAYPQDTILELPEKEQNGDNTNGYSDEEMRQHALVVQ